MTASVLDRSAIATDDCRFPEWCNGSCDVQATGERSHWSNPKDVTGVETYDTVSVELFEYEGPGHENVAVVVCLALGDGVTGVSCTSFTAAQARELGALLLGVRPADHPYSDAMLWHHVHGGDAKHGPDTYVELRQPRYWRDGHETPLVIEVSIREGAEAAVDRTQMNLLDARTLGRWLVEAAGQADASNLKYGLVADEAGR